MLWLKEMLNSVFFVVNADGTDKLESSYFSFNFYMKDMKAAMFQKRKYFIVKVCSEPKIMDDFAPIYRHFDVFR